MSKATKNSTTTPAAKSEKKQQLPPVEKPPIWLYFAGFILAWIAFYPALQNGILSWDDTGYLNDQEVLLQSLNPIVFFKKFAVMGNYHPLTMYLYALIYQSAGLENAQTYHLINLLLHGVNVLLCIKVVHALIDNKLVRIWVPLLFAIHPLKTESVVWISETKDVLYTLFYFLALLQYIRFTKTANFKNYGLAFLFFLLSCFSKGMAVTFAAVLFAVDIWLDRKLELKTILQKIPFLAISLLFGLIAYYAQKQNAGFYTKAEAYSLLERGLVVSYSFSFYLIKMIVPYHLGILYPYPKVGQFGSEYYLSAVLLLSYVAAVFYFRKDKIVLGALVFYFVCIIPVTQLVPVGESVAFDRYFYLSSFGLLILACYGISKLALQQLKLKENIVHSFFAVVVLLFTFVANARSKDWHDNLSLWGSMIETNPSFDKSYYAFGEYYQGIGDSTNAFKYYRDCLQRNPENKKAHINIGNCYYNFSKNMDLAMQHYQLSLKADSSYYLAYLSIGNMLYMKQQLNEAERCYKKSIALDSTFSMTYYNLALVQLQMQKKAAADSNLVHAAHLHYQPAVDLLAKPH